MTPWRTAFTKAKTGNDGESRLRQCAEVQPARKPLPGAYEDKRSTTACKLPLPTSAARCSGPAAVGAYESCALGETRGRTFCCISVGLCDRYIVGACAYFRAARVERQRGIHIASAAGTEMAGFLVCCAAAGELHERGESRRAMTCQESQHT